MLLLANVEILAVRFFRSMVLIYLPDGANVYDSRVRELDVMGWVYRGLKVVKSYSQEGRSYSLLKTLLL